METRYEIEPERIGRATDRRRPIVAVAVALVVLAAVLAKPWGGPEVPTPTGPAPSAPALAAASPGSPTLRPRPIVAEPPAAPTWPSAGAPSLLATQTAKEAEGALGSLVGHAGIWGVGNAGVGPRMIRDEPWFDWTSTPVEIVDGPPVHMTQWPGTDLCAGYPLIYDRPVLVAVTTPRDVVPDRVLRGWWSDGGHVAPLDGSVVQVSPPGNRGITYLERIDQAAWPPGLYEFHIVTASGSVALTVCLTRVA